MYPRLATLNNLTIDTSYIYLTFIHGIKRTSHPVTYKFKLPRRGSLVAPRAVIRCLVLFELPSAPCRMPILNLIQCSALLCSFLKACRDTDPAKR
jgi:hypothetical protein